MRRAISIVMAAASLLVCLLTPLLVFFGRLGVEQYKFWFLIGTLSWFVFGVMAGRKQAQ